MADTQLENGYTKVANGIVEALCGIRVPGEARQIVDVIIRKTYGFNKKEDIISLSQFCLLTRMRRTDVCRAINKAAEMNIIRVISKEANGMGNKYCLVKDFDTWKPLAKKRRGVAKKLIGISKKANLVVAKKLHTKDRVKETVTKDTYSGDVASPNYLGHGVSDIFTAFREVNKSYKNWYEDKRQVKAARNLIEVRTREVALKVISALQETNRLKYMPKITSPTELEEKWERLHIQAHAHVEEMAKGDGRGKGIA